MKVSGNMFRPHSDQNFQGNLDDLLVCNATDIHQTSSFYLEQKMDFLLGPVSVDREVY